MNDQTSSRKTGHDQQKSPGDMNPETGHEIASALMGFSVSDEMEEPGHFSLGEHLTGDCHMRILMALRRIMHFVDAYSRKLSIDYHITGPQLICLHTIVNDGPMTLSALGKRVSLSMSTVNGIIDRLELKNLVVRKRTDPDRRKVIVSATDAGVCLSREAPLPLQNKLVQAISDLPELEQVSIALSLERIVDMMEEKQHPDHSRHRD